MAGTENLLRQITWGAKQQVEREQATYWEAKWGWNPFYPDLNEVRRLYGQTQIYWQVRKPMQYEQVAESRTVDCYLGTANSLALMKRSLDSLSGTEYPRERIDVY